MLIENVRKADFFPIGPLHDKHNYKRYSYIQKDGTILERVHLDVSDQSHREHLICCHYLRHLARNLLKQDVSVKVLGRDTPWDFELELSSGDAFFLEITSIADNQRLFEINKREERLSQWAGTEYIPLHELKKLAYFFPDSDLEKSARHHERQGLVRSELVPNPMREGGPQLFLSNIPEPESPLSQLIQSAIEKKAAKPHDDKENVAIIIDNRTGTFDVEDYRIAARTLEGFLIGIPFREVWFYTGYYSDDDGNNAEFSFSPLKVTIAQEKGLQTLQVDSNGRHIW